MSAAGMILTGRQAAALSDALALVETMCLAFGSANSEESLSGLGLLANVVFGKLEEAVSPNDQEEEMMRHPEMLSGLVYQLQELHDKHGDMRVFTGDMEPMADLEVVTAPEDPEKHGACFLHVGP